MAAKTEKNIAALPATVATAILVKTENKNSNKTRAVAVQKPKKKSASHPPVYKMVITAIRTLDERHGSSLRAIRKYIATNYLCDVDKLSRFIKQALKKGVENETLVQVKGIGANGSFKLKKSVSKTPTDRKLKVEKKPRKKGTTQKKQPAARKRAFVVQKGTASASVTKKQKSTNPTKTASKTTPKLKKVAPGRKASSK